MNGVHPSDAPSFQVTPQLVLGLLIVFVGVVFTLDELGVANARTYLRYWPSAIIVILCSNSEPPSGTTSIPTCRAASMIICRCSRRGWL